MSDDRETLELTAEERAALIAWLKRTIEGDRFPLAPRLAPLRAILEKLAPPKPPPLPAADAAPSHGRYRSRR